MSGLPQHEGEIQAPYVRVVLAIPADGQGLDDILDAIRSFELAELRMQLIEGHYSYSAVIVDSEIKNRVVDTGT